MAQGPVTPKAHSSREESDWESLTNRRVTLLYKDLYTAMVLVYKGLQGRQVIAKLAHENR